jgi:hypothetical protein
MKRIALVPLAAVAAASLCAAQTPLRARTAPNPTPFGAQQTGSPTAGCGVKDDGTTENALGLTAGGEMGWLTVWDDTCLDAVNSVETAYGTLMFPGSVTNGANSEVVLYEDTTPDDNPTTNLTVVAKASTVVVNGDTDILNKVPLSGTATVTGTQDVWSLVSADQVAGQFPGPMDQTAPTHTAGAWVVGSTLGPGSLIQTHSPATTSPR